MDESSHLTPIFGRARSPQPSKVAAPFTSFDIFPTLPRPWHTAAPSSARRRRGLATIPHAFKLPSDGSEASEFVAASPQTRGSAANFLDALRNRTLLDLSCMREFSLLRYKPMAERNLSRLSVTSAYNMHSEQLHLRQLVVPGSPRRSQSATKADASRQTSPVKRDNAKIRGLRARLAHEHRKLSLAPGSRDGHIQFTPSPGASDRTFIASPPSKSSPTSREQRNSRPVRRPQTKPTPASSTQAVTEHHGFLQEQDLALLMSATGYSRAELFARWTRFKALCSMAKTPHGVDKETLRHGVPQLSVEDQFFVDRAFDVLDADGSGALDWPEFIAALSALEKGDASRRVDFLFHAYDLNGDGFIQREEVLRFFLASLLVPQTPEALEVSRHFVSKIFISLGREQFDSIRVQDAMRYLHEHPATDAYSLLGRTMVTSTATPASVTRRSNTRPISISDDLQSGE